MILIVVSFGQQQLLTFILLHLSITVFELVAVLGLLRVFVTLLLVKESINASKLVL